MKSVPCYAASCLALLGTAGAASSCSRRQAATGSSSQAAQASDNSNNSSSSSASSASSASISVPSSSNSSDTIDQNFLAWAFEEASFVYYALDLDGNTNNFSVNLIDAVTSRTGGTPLIRLGGTSADYAKYVANQSTPALPVAVDEDDFDVGNTTIGPSYWALTSVFPNAQYTIQVPLATTDINETITWARTALDTIGADNMHSIEIGNEPDWYSEDYQGTWQTLGPPEWQGSMSNATYVGNFTAAAEAIAAAVDLPADRFFQAFDTAARVSEPSEVLCYKLDVGTCFGDLGIDDGGRVKTVAHHYYQDQFHENSSTLYSGSGLMNMSYTHARADYFRCQLDYLRDNRPDVPFVLSEVGNSLAEVSAPQYQAVLGSALWQVDFSLYAMALGVARVHAQQLLADIYQPILWLPVEYLGASPHVTPNYYALPFVADFIGASGASTMAQLNVTPAVENLSAYVAYESGSPVRVAVVNLDYWNQTSSGTDRPSESIELEVPSGVSSVTVDYLSSPLGAGADSSTVTYAGSQWTYDSLGTEVTGVRDDSQTLSVSDGLVTVTVNSSSAALVSFSY